MVAVKRCRITGRKKRPYPDWQHRCLEREKCKQYHKDMLSFRRHARISPRQHGARPYEVDKHDDVCDLMRDDKRHEQ